MTETRRKEPTMTLDATQQARLDDDAEVGGIGARWVRVAEAAPVEYRWHDETDIARLLEVDLPAILARFYAARAELEELRGEVGRWQQKWKRRGRRIRDLAAQVDTLTAEVEEAESNEGVAVAEAERLEAENATLRAQVEALATRLEDRDPHANIPRRSAARLIRDALDAASPTPHTPTKEHQ